MHTQWYKFTHEVPTAKTFAGSSADVDVTNDRIRIANHGTQRGQSLE